VSRSGPWLAVLGLALAALDLARPYAGPSLRPVQLACAAVFLVVLALWLHAREWRRRESLPLLALAVFLLPTYLDHSRNLESDGIHYYGYLRSLLFDGDLDLWNDYVLLGWSEPEHRNVLPVGAPLMWSPFVLVVHLGRQVARLFGAGAPTGTEPVYQAAANLATLVYGATGLFLLLDTLRRWGAALPRPLWSAAAVFWAVVICWIGSPLRFYLSVLPCLAHGAEFFAAVLVLRAYVALRDRPDPVRAAWAGAACGLVFLVRSQDGILLALPGTALALAWLRGPDRRRPALAFAALAGAFVLVALPQMAVWQAMFGRPVLIPHKVLHGEEFMHLAEPQLAGTLLSPRGGLFVTHPMMLAAFAGLAVLAFRDARYVLAVLPVLLAGWYVNSTLFDWYHVRRFTGLVPLLAPGLALALTPLSRAGVAAMALVAFLALRYDYAVDTLRALPGEPVPARAALRETSDGLVRDAYRVVEPRAPRLAVLGVLAYTGEALLREGPVARIDLATEHPLLRVPFRTPYLSEVTAEDGAPCRWLRGQQTRLHLPLAWEGAVTLTLRARALETLEPQAVEALWNGVPVGRHATPAEWSSYRFDVPREAVRLGANELVLRFDRAPIYRRIRGEGPREVRPAALAWMTLHRRKAR